MLIVSAYTAVLGVGSMCLILHTASSTYTHIMVIPLQMRHVYCDMLAITVEPMLQ